MVNTSKQLNALISEIAKSLADKKKEIDNAGASVIPHVSDAFKIRQRELLSFQLRCKEVTLEALQKADLMVSLKTAARDLINGIKNIKV
jgi:Uri superfamily endonuclease